MKPTVSVSARKVLLLSLCVVFILAVLGIGVLLYKSLPGAANSRLFSDNPNLGFLNLFDLKKEGSIGTWYSSSLLLLCSALLAAISIVRKQEGGRYVNHWRALSIIFLYLSVDEGTTIHEKMGPILRPTLRSFDLELGGFLSRAWVVPAAALLFVFVLAYLGFFFALPARQRLFFLVSGILYVGGAMGLEMLDGFLSTSFDGRKGVASTMVPVGEESLEMIGITVFAYALLTYMGFRRREVTFRIKERDAD